uniref:Pre-mRNA-splicing factor SLU7 n=1 Tax=Parascaris univalens TaxID=6257 RepID=A0A914ZRY8_PARUN
MAGSSQIPASELIRRGVGIGDVQEGRKTKDEYRKQKDLEEERKLGIAPAMVDVETGRDINPHIPEFIAKNPWYVPSTGPTLKHQRPHEERHIKYSSIDEWYKRGASEKVASKFRKGACENCGSMTHKKKDCFERPRKLGAKWTGEDIAPDEYVQPNLVLSWDAKRDRWNGYDPQSHQQVVEEYEKLEMTRKMLREEKMKEGLLDDEESAEGKKQEGDEQQLCDEDMYADDADMAGVTVDMDSRTRITVRNLRIREDTAKYLYNLDPNGPYYDPKSRSMRENPFAGVPGKEKEAAKFAGENFVRYTGEVVQANEAQVFAWQARCKGIDVHALAEPTKLEAMRKEFEEQKMKSKDVHKEKLIEKYGGEEYLNAPPKELLLAQTEHYVEYSRKGTVIKGEERPAVRSRYEEDKYINNHTSVWGSYWHAGQWGYGCCHSFLFNSYCIGKAGIETEKEIPLLPKPLTVNDHTTEQKPQTSELGKETVEKEESSENSSSSESGSESDSNSDEEVDSENERELALERERELEKRKRDEKRREKKREKRKRQKERHSKRDKRKINKHEKDASNSGTSSSADDDDTKRELEKAVKKANKEWNEAEKTIAEGDRKRKYHSNYDITAPTEAEMEAYRLTTIHSADPMAAYITEKRRKQSK